MNIYNLKSILKFLFFLTLGIFLIWMTTRSLSQQEINEVKYQLSNANFEILIPSLFIIILSNLVRAMRWKIMISSLSYEPRTLNVFFSVVIGLFFNLLFPRLGELMKCTILGKQEDIPVDKLFGTMVAERLIDIICLLIIVAITIFSQYQRVGDFAKESLERIYHGILSNFDRAIWFLLIISLTALVLFFLYKTFYKNNAYGKLKSIVQGILLGIGSIRKIQKRSLFVFYTITIWLLYLYGIKLGFLAFDEISTLGWIPSLTILTFGTFAMIATQGGIGAYQLAVQKTLALYQIREVTGLALGWLIWSVQTIFLLISGPLSLLLMSIFNKKRKVN